MNRSESCSKLCSLFKSKGKCSLVKMVDVVVHSVPPEDKQTPISQDPLDNTKATYEAEIAHRLISEIHVLAKELGCNRISEELDPKYPGRNKL